jgi:pimeloyl-ACP methyl ester carboxylesterase
MSGDDLVFYIYDAFYVTDALPHIPALLDAGLKGNLAAFMRFYWYPYMADWSLSEGVFLSVWCREISPFTDHAVLAANAATYGALGRAGAAIDTSPACADWPIAPLPEANREPVRSDIPVLFVNGAYDPVTPPEWSDDLMAGFPHGRHLVFAGEGHTPTGDGGCGTATAIGFLESAAGGAPFAMPACKAYTDPPDFEAAR